jgi:hypothetical protein
MPAGVIPLLIPDPQPDVPTTTQETSAKRKDVNNLSRQKFEKGQTGIPLHFKDSTLELRVDVDIPCPEDGETA